MTGPSVACIGWIGWIHLCHLLPAEAVDDGDDGRTDCGGDGSGEHVTPWNVIGGLDALLKFVRYAEATSDP